MDRYGPQEKIEDDGENSEKEDASGHEAILAQTKVVFVSGQKVNGCKWPCFELIHDTTDLLTNLWI